MIMLLLMLSGNVQPNPWPITPMYCLPTPSDFKSRTGLGFMNLNVRILVPILDMIKIWVNTTNADIQ